MFVSDLLSQAPEISLISSFLATNNNITMKMPRNIMPTPLESMIRLFVVTIGEFTVFYREMNNCSATEKAILGKFLTHFKNVFEALLAFLNHF
jgi:hypothetical protein